MANETNATTDSTESQALAPAQVALIAERDARIEKLEVELKTMSEKHAFQKNRADGLEASVKDSSTELARLRKSPKAPPIEKGTCVVIDGIRHESIGTFR